MAGEFTSGVARAGGSRRRATGRLTVRALASEALAPLHELPNTGIPPERELRLSAPFVRHGSYGTRASTVILVDDTGRATLIERGFGPDGVPLGERRIGMPLQGS